MFPQGTGTGEMYYRWISDSTYEFTYVRYEHYPAISCGWILNPLFQASSDSLNFVFGYIPGLYTHLPQSGINVPSLYPDGLANCSGISIRDTLIQNEMYREWVYRLLYTLPGKADDWVFRTYMSCGGGYDNANGSPFYAECGINNLDFPGTISGNNSPMWLNRRPNVPGHLKDTLKNYPVISVCRNRSYVSDQRATEYDGDIIRYSIPGHGHYADTNYLKFINGFSSDYFMPSDTPPPLRIDSITGQIFFKPIQHNLPGARWKDWTNYYTVPVMAREYRMDTTWIGGLPIVKRKQIGYITRFITFVVTPDSLCADSNVVFVDTANHLPTTFVELNCDDNPFKIAFSDPLRCNSVDSNASCFLLISQGGDTIPLTKAEAVCRHDDAADDVKIYTDSLLEAGSYYLYFKTGDDSNSLITQCGRELVSFSDTLLVIRNGSPEVEDFWNDSLGIQRNYLEVPCRETSMTFYTSHPVKCKTVRSNGSDFYLVDSGSTTVIHVPIIKATVGNCQNGFTSEITLDFTSAIEAGTYDLYLKEGTDSNTLFDACHRKWLPMTKEVRVPEVDVDLGSDIKICSRDEVYLTLSAPNGYTYKWSTGAFSQQIQVTTYGTYWVQVWSQTGCLGTDTINIIEINCTGIEEEKGKDQNSFSIYPNPARDVIYISNQKGENTKYDLEILSSAGQVSLEMKNLRSEKQEIKLPDNLSGLYLVRIKGDGFVFTEKLLIH